MLLLNGVEEEHFVQFDPAMKPIFLGCRRQLEEYYAEVNRPAATG